MAIMRDYWLELLELLSEDDLIRLIKRAQMRDKPELAGQLAGKLGERRQLKTIATITGK